MAEYKHFKFPTLESAWAGINEYMVNNYDEIVELGGGVYGTQMMLYNAVVKVEKAWISPKFDFAAILGYTERKWTKLISNYVDLNYLDLVKRDVQAREKKKTVNYTHSFHFSNKHESGKDCLISLIFQRQMGNDRPTVIYHTRAVEATKRMIFDFLLIQRIVEYVYGEGVTVEVEMVIPFVFVAAEGVILFSNYLPIKKLVHNWENPNRYQSRVIAAWEKLSNVDPETIKYKVHKRSANGIQKGADGKPLHKRKALLVENLGLFRPASNPKVIEKLNSNLA